MPGDRTLLANGPTVVTVTSRDGTTRLGPNSSVTIGPGPKVQVSYQEPHGDTQVREVESGYTVTVLRDGEIVITPPRGPQSPSDTNIGGIRG